MAILNASRVGQSFGEFDVFSGVSVSIPRDGKVGLVGPNGVGKTTLLLILAGRAQPSAGAVHVARGTRIGYLSQESSDAFVGAVAEHTVYDEMLTVFAKLRAIEDRLRELEQAMAAPVETFRRNVLASANDPTETLQRNVSTPSANDPTETFQRNVSTSADDPTETFQRNASTSANDPTETFQRNVSTSANDPTETFQRNVSTSANDPTETFQRNVSTSANDLLDEYSRLQVEYEVGGGYEYDTRIRMVLTGLGFAPQAWGQPLSQLSGGQKTRVLLGRLLLEAPDLLILDEPTNHLDVQAIEWLENTLNTWPGAVLVVSHDRYFLDRVAKVIWEMSRGGVESYRGNYSAYLTQRQDRWQRLQSEYETFQERAAKELDFIRRNISGQRTQMAWGKLSRLSREVEAVRVGGLGAIGDLSSKGWSQVAGALDLRRPAATLAELEAAIAALPAPAQPPVVNFRLNAAFRSGNVVLRAADLAVGYPGRPLFTVPELELHRLETAALIGPNGTGKTTFLKVILGQLEPLAGKLSLGASLHIGYFAQAQEALDPNATVLDELLRHKDMLISEARNYLARYLFRGDDVFSQVGTLSGGERARLALAILVLEQANFLLLDEPTNHLDIASQEILQSALEAFDGTILLVTHDRYLVDRLASQIWELKEDAAGRSRLEVFKGPYQEYLTARAGKTTAEPPPAAPTPASNGGAAAPPRLSKNEQRRRAETVAAVEGGIAETEATLAALGDGLQRAAAAQDYAELQRLTAEYAAAEARLESLFAEWEALTHEPADHRADG